MRCGGCGQENREGRKFCGGCGARLALACPACGTPTEADERFCGECGAALSAPGPQGGGAAAQRAPARPGLAAGERSSRAVVTIIFADLVGSTALHERLDAESVRQFMDGYYAAMRGAVEAHGGHVTQVMGDGVKAVFGAPRVAEDDAIRAVRAGVEMQRAFRALAEQQEGRVGKTGLRVAVNTGEVVSDGETEIIGDPVNVAARLQEQGKDGDVVIGGSTQRIVSSLVTLDRLGSFALKGRSEQVEAYRVVSLEPPPATKAAFVGRDGELARLALVYDTAVAKPAAQLAVLLGSPGLGKSRLIDEFVHRLGDTASVLLAHCDAAGGPTFAPLVAALRARLGLEEAAKPEALRAAIEALLPTDDPERPRIAAGVAALLAGSPASPEETFFVVRRLLAALAQTKPVVLVIDDLHWAESLLLDLVEHLVQWGGGVPLFVLVGARPELRELRSSLVLPGGFVGDVLTLAGLDAGAAMRLAAGVIGAVDLPAALAAKLLASSEGNPLFVRELVKMLVQEGVLHRDGERWVASAALADLEMPPTIHALLAARIERLRPEERAVLERAAVVGRHFSKSAVAALLSQTSDLDARLEALRRSELIERDTGWFLGEPVLRFHHVLIRDAAYRRILKGTRAELHARLAGWIEAKVGEAAEHDEVIGWHLEQAHQHLAELGPLDAAGTALGERAAGRLASAGRRALARDDVPVAGSLLGRALACLPVEAAERADLALDWCEALLSAGDVATAGSAIAELARAGGDSPRLRAWHTCFAGQLTALTEPQSLNATADAVAAAAEELAALEDAAGEAKAHFVHAQALARLGKVGACEAALDRALAAARRAGDRRRANAVLAGAPLAALWGPSPVTRASGRCLDVVRVLRITQGAPAVEAVALSCQGVLEALRGRTDAARRMLASSRKLVEELGIAHRLFEADAFAGRIEAMEGDAAAAERLLRGAYEGLRDLGLGIDAARAGSLLARSLLAQGRAAEAEALSHESEALAGDDLQASIAWRGVRAEALAQRGEHAAAIELAQAAVSIAAATDALLDHADARMALAAALRAAGRRSDADAEERRAVELWEAKGATLLAERARREDALVSNAAAVPAPAARPTQRRRVRPNVATENSALFDAAVAARDVAAFSTLYADDMRVVDHTTETEFGRAGCLASWRALAGAQEPTSQHEPLATLGDSLGLLRLRISACGTSRGRMDVGAYEKDDIHLVETDARARRCAGETWAPDHLGDAIVRLYERYAELLPEGSARECAAAIARSVEAMLTASAEQDFEASVAPDFEAVDHRLVGHEPVPAQALQRGFEATSELEDERSFRVDDVLGLTRDAFLRRTTHSGVVRASGGSFERTVLALTVFRTDGRITRHETFDVAQEAEALARFDELTAGAAAPQPVRRRVRANAATATSAAADAAFAAGDMSAFAALWSDSLVFVDHPTRSRYGRDGLLAGIAALRRSRDAKLRQEPIATLGDFLGLATHRASASGAAGGRFDVGSYEREAYLLGEVDGQGRLLHMELFAPDHLGDAIACLYERHAELLPEGPERERAAAAARSFAAMASQPDTARRAAVFAEGIEVVDHRTLGTWSARGAAEALRHFASLHDVADAPALRDHDVLALAPAALLVERAHTGFAKQGGGAYERRFLMLLESDASGRLARIEWFDTERETEALARFDELTAGAAAPQPARRRVRANAATRSFARVRPLLAARDAAALAQLFDESLHVVHHPTRVTYGRREMLGTWRSALRAERLEFRQEMLASLGDTLALDRHVWTIEGLNEAHLTDFGLTELDEVSLLEVNERGAWIRSEIFAPDRLGDAVVRLYERHAERLPEGAARARAEATARTVAVVAPGGFDADRYAAAFRPDAAIVDRKLLGWGSEVGPERLFRAMAETRQVGDQLVSRPQDVLVLTHDALLLRWLVSGVGRESGGAFEWAFLRLFVFGAEGRVARYELFDADCQAEALARFDALTAGGEAPPVPERFANAASRANQALTRSFEARDWAGFEARLAPSLVFDERRRMLHNICGREVFLEQARLLSDVPGGRFTSRLVATRGERLALHCSNFEGQVAGGGGPLEMGAYLDLDEVDAEGRIVAKLLFDAEDEDAAYTELDARYETGEGAAHAGAWGWMRAFTRSVATRDWEALVARSAPSVVAQDHRSVGWGTLSGPAGWVEAPRAMIELAPDARLRIDHLRTSSRGILFENTWLGTRDGGAFEIPQISVFELDALGRQQRLDLYDLAQLDRALARFESLARDSSLAPADVAFENAAARAARNLFACFNARDWAGVEALAAPDLIFDERRRLVRNTCGREIWLEQFRIMFDLPRSRFTSRLLATRGERLSLNLHHFEGEVAGGGGPLEMEGHFALHEVDAEGRIVVIVLFDPEDADAAYAELDARYDAGEGAVRSRAWRADRAAVGALARRDWERLVALCAPDLVEHDHRGLAVLGTTRGAEGWVGNFRTLVELAPDTIFRNDHFLAGAHGFCAFGRFRGSREGGDFEIPLAVVVELDEQDRFARCDIYDPEQRGQALARFAEIVALAAETPFANAATRAVERGAARIAARDWEGFAALFAPGFRNFDRTSIGKLEVDREKWLAAFRQVIELTTGPLVPRVLATRGDRLALVRLLWEGAGGDVGASELDWLLIIEVDERGDHIAVVSFDPGDLDAAYGELDARYEAHAPAWMPGFCRALSRRDWHAIAGLCAGDLVAENHRLVSWGTLRGISPYLSSLRSMVDLAPDARLRLDHLRAAGRAELFEVRWLGTRDGGAFEIPVNGVIELDERRRQRRLDLYDLEKLDQASVRFAEIAAAAPAEERFANAATRSWREVIGTWQRRDLERFTALHPAAFRYRDRRRLFLLDLDREQFLDFTRPLLEMRTASASTELLATRGERLALVRHCTELADGDVGASAIDSLLLDEIDEHGLPQQYLRFDLDDEAAARAELDARFAAGEAAAYPLAAAWLAGYLRAFAARDWDAMAALLAPDLVAENHRLVGWGTLFGPAALVSTLTAQVELAPDTRERVDHVRLCERGVLFEYAWCGTREGGAFENLWIVGVELDAFGRGRRAEVWEPEQLAQALAWFGEIAARGDPGAHPFANAASRHVARMLALGRASGWQASLAEMLPATFRFHDRRRLALLDLDREGYAEYVHSISEARSMQVDSELIATRGEKLALVRQRISLAGGDVGASELVNLSVYEVGERGDCIALVRFDDDAPDAAHAELDARFEAGEAAAHPAASAWVAGFRRAFASRDWAALAALHAPDQVAHNHRLVGWGTLRGPGAWVPTLQEYVALAPDVQQRVHHLRICERGSLWHFTWHGSRDGGAFEAPMLLVVELDENGLERQIDVWEPEQLDAALARFAEIGASAAHDPLAAITKPNAASGWLGRFQTPFNARDWDAVRDLFAAHVAYEDRQRFSLLSGGLDLLLSSLRERAEAGARLEHFQLLGTAGDRVAIQRVLFSGGGAGNRFEMEFVVVHEVDGAGRLIATINFDSGDARAAQREAWARWARIDPAVAPLIGPLGEIIDASNTWDRARYRAQLAEDLVVDDHRRTGMGRIDGPDAYLASVAAFGGLVSGATGALGWHWPALAPHGAVTTTHISGTVAASAGEFESAYLYLFTLSRGRVARIELFELEHLDAALARFEALRAGRDR